MNDLVGAVPMHRWLQWLAEGELPGDPPEEGADWNFYVGSVIPHVEPGADARFYIVAHGLLRGYAPIASVKRHQGRQGGSLIRRGGAVAVSLKHKEVKGELQPAIGFHGVLRRWWHREEEVPFDDWTTRGLPIKLQAEVEALMKLRATGPAARKKLRAWGLGLPWRA